MPSFSYLPAEQAQTYRSERTLIHVWHPVPGVLVSRVEGHYTGEAAAFVAAIIRRHARIEPRLLFLLDWWEVDDYDREAREILVALARELSSVTDGNHILFQSKLVAFGVQAASFVLRNITAYTDRASFERALNEAVRKRAATSRRV